MTGASMEMPKYRSHKEVWALKIARLQHTGSPDQEADGSLIMTPEDARFAPILLSAEYVAKHRPKVGGYYVVYDGGYESWSPAEAFETGYTLID